DLAEKRFEERLEKFPSDGPVLTSAVPFFETIGKSERANEIMRKALSLAPESYSYRSTLALRLVEQGKKDEAETVLREGTQVASRAAAAQAWAGLGSFLMEQGRVDDAIAAFEKARQLGPEDSAELLLAHADALVIAGRLDEAVALIDQIKLPAHKAVLRARI